MEGARWASLQDFEITFPISPIQSFVSFVMTLLSRDIYYQKEINEFSINLNYTSKKIKALSHKADYYFFSL